MREILFRGFHESENGKETICLDGREIKGEWVEGFLYINSKGEYEISYYSKAFNIERYTYDVIPETVGQYTGLTDKNGKKIFEGDIVQYCTYDDFDCQSIVKFGKYEQDGSDGEYNARDCIGFYVEVDNFTCPDWCENYPEYFRDYYKQQNLLEVVNECEVIGNIHDNPKLLGVIK